LTPLADENRTSLGRFVFAGFLPMAHLAVREQITYTAVMARKPEAKTQRQRFIEAAREIGADDAQAFDRALKKIGSAPGEKAKKAARKSKR
jgi:hypothetical protein